MNTSAPLTTVSREPRFQDLHSRIARKAWELWQFYRRPSGREAEIWLEAEQRVAAGDARWAAAAANRGQTDSPASA